MAIEHIVILDVAVSVCDSGMRGGGLTQLHHIRLLLAQKLGLSLKVPSAESVFVLGTHGKHRNAYRAAQDRAYLKDENTGYVDSLDRNCPDQLSYAKHEPCFRQEILDKEPLSMSPHSWVDNLHTCCSDPSRKVQGIKDGYNTREGRCHLDMFM